MSSEIDPLSDQVFHQVLALLRTSRQYGRLIMDECGLKPVQLSVLRSLLEKGPATVSQVQAYVQHSASSTSTMIAQLETAGFVTRTRSADDNRVVIVELTPSGHDVAEKTPLGGLPLLRRELAALHEERLAEMEEVLLEIMQLMGDSGR